MQEEAAESIRYSRCVIPRQVAATASYVLKWNGAGGSSMYSVSKDKQLLELQRVDGADYSWFLDDNVVSGGSKLPLFVVSNAALQMAPSLCVHLSILFSWRFISSRKRGTRSGAALIDPPRLELITIHAD